LKHHKAQSNYSSIVKAWGVLGSRKFGMHKKHFWGGPLLSLTSDNHTMSFAMMVVWDTPVKRDLHTGDNDLQATGLDKVLADKDAELTVVAPSDVFGWENIAVGLTTEFLAGVFANKKKLAQVLTTRSSRHA
jgi:hypothetical protein